VDGATARKHSPPHRSPAVRPAARVRLGLAEDVGAVSFHPGHVGELSPTIEAKEPVGDLGVRAKDAPGWWRCLRRLLRLPHRSPLKSPCRNAGRSAGNRPCRTRGSAAPSPRGDRTGPRPRSQVGRASRV